MSDDGPDRGRVDGVRSPDRLLPCGRSAESLLEAASEPGTVLDTHQQHCPHCLRTLTALRQQWAVVRAEALTPPPVPPGLVERMASRVRTAIREPNYLQVPTPEGQLRIACSVIEQIVRQIVDERGLPVEGCRTIEEPPGLVVEVHVVLPYGRSAAAEAEGARQAVIAGVAALTGLDVAVVDVLVVDIAVAR
jgi:uncharacterized alkaline shock family protein YloU